MDKKVLKTTEEIYQRIEEIYKNESGKKFITHLIRSFFPVDKATFIWDKKDDKPIFCCISGIELTSKGEAMQAMLDTTPEEFGAYLKQAFTINTETQEPGEVMVPQTIEHPVRKKLGEKILGIESAESDKYICKEVHQQLYNFYANNLLRGDGHMNWLGKRMVADRVIENLKSENNITPEEEKVIDKRINKPHKVTFGDLTVLQQLKEKLEKEEKK